MPDELTPEQVQANAAAVRVRLTPEAARRIVGATKPTAVRFAAADLTIPFETEPATFTCVQQRERNR